jgi:hypothetical protein
MTSLIINNEDDAYRILANINNGEIISEPKIDINQLFSIHIEGKKFNQSITPTVMRGLVEFQKSIYQAYATAKYNSPSKRLSEEEKNNLEINISVKGGSSNLEINVQELAIKFIEQIGGKMGTTEIITLGIAFFVLYFGSTAYKLYLENRKEIRLKEISDETQIKTLQTLEALSKQETERAKIIADLANKNHRIENIIRLSDDAHTEIIKALCASDNSEIQGIKINKEIAELLTKNARRTSSEVRLDGIYKILKFDSSSNTKYRVRIQNVESNIELDADIQDNLIDEFQKSLLTKSLVNREAIFLQINALMWSDEEYHSALIINISNS